jgi:hypothetical protein
MVFKLTHSQVILRYKENGGRIKPYYSNHDPWVGTFRGCPSALPKQCLSLEEPVSEAGEGGRG